MNKLSLLLSTILLSFISFNASSNDLSYSLTVKKSIVKIDFKSVNKNLDEVLLEVLSETGEQLLSKKVEVSETLKAEFDVSSLEKGSYVFQMKFEDKEVKKRFKLSKSKRVSMRDYSLRTKNRAVIIIMNGSNLKIETTTTLKNNIDLSFLTSDGSERLLYEASFSSGKNTISNIDLRTLGEAQFILNYKEQGVTYTEKFIMY